MPARQEKRGEVDPHRMDEAAAPPPEPKKNRETRDDGRGRDASRTGSDSNAS